MTTRLSILPTEQGGRRDKMSVSWGGTPKSRLQRGVQPAYRRLRILPALRFQMNENASRRRTEVGIGMAQPFRNGPVSGLKLIGTGVDGHVHAVGAEGGIAAVDGE